MNLNSFMIVSVVFCHSQKLYKKSIKFFKIKQIKIVASTASTAGAVPGSAYERYTGSEVLELLEMNEPMLADSDDDLELDLGSGDET